MPVYEFLCKKCSHRFDVVRARERAGEGATCPKCRGAGRRLFGANMVGIESGDFDLDEFGAGSGAGAAAGHGHEHGPGGLGGMDDFDDDF